MTAYLIPGILGLLTGLILRWCGFAHPGGLRTALALRRGTHPRYVPLRSGLAALGYAIAGTALLIWLAVVDVDALLTLPVGWRVLLGGGLFGLCAALCGFTPSTAFAGLGAGNALEALCTLAGLFLMTLFLPEGQAVPAAQGDLLTQGCAGLLLAAIALCIPNPKPVLLTVEPAPAPAPVDAPDPLSDPEDVPDPESAADDAFVAILEGEEPLVIDTESTDESPDESPEPDEDQA